MGYWPITLTEGRIGLRPLRLRDGKKWKEIRKRNGAWLKPWDATLPIEADGNEAIPSYAQMVRRLNAEARAGRALPWALTYDDVLVGQVTVGGIAWGSYRGGYIGYWIDSAFAGRGIMPMAVAMATDCCFRGLGMHRLEINIRPENEASRRVAQKAGYRFEGIRPKFLHIDGDWRDHESYALVSSEVDGLLVQQLRAARVTE